MDNKIFSKFNIYDQIGYLLVGSVGLIVVTANLYLIGKSILIPPFNIENFLAWFIVAYFLGHVIQAIANLFIKENKTNFSEHEKEILKEAKKYFKVEKYSLNEIYSLCYMLSSARDVTGQVQSFNSYYSLYRGWMIIFIINSIYTLVIFILNWFSLLYLLIFIFSCIFVWLFYKRLKRFYLYSRNKVLDTFIILSKNKI